MNSKNISIRSERRSELLEEYKICNNKASEMDQLIWSSSKILGIGSLGGILISSFSLDNNHMAPQQIFILGLFLVVSTWIWWGIAKRWWDVQHTAYQRMRDIEKILGFGMARYISCKEGRLDVDKLEFPPEEDKYIDKEKLEYSRKYKKGGVQAWMRFFPPLVTLIWVLYIFITFSKNGGLIMGSKIVMSVELFVIISCSPILFFVIGWIFHKGHIQDSLAESKKTIKEKNKEIDNLKKEIQEVNNQKN